MKKIFTTLALLGGIATGAMAQKTVDLKFSIATPANGATYANVTAGDSMNIKFTIENLGTDNVVASDSLTFWIAGYTFNMSNGQIVWNGSRQYGFDIPAGQSQEVSYWVTKGSGYVSNGDTIVNWFNDNDTNVLVIEGYGMDQNGQLFTDAGVDNSNPNGDGALTGNNHAESIYILGTTTRIKNTELTKAMLHVYPNPAVNEINFDYTFDHSSDAVVKVLDITGREVYTQNYGKQAAGKQSFQINVADFSNGMYTIELITDGTKAISKFNVAK